MEPQSFGPNAIRCSTPGFGFSHQALFARSEIARSSPYPHRQASWQSCSQTQTESRIVGDLTLSVYEAVDAADGSNGRSDLDFEAIQELERIVERQMLVYHPSCRLNRPATTAVPLIGHAYGNGWLIRSPERLSQTSSPRP